MNNFRSRTIYFSLAIFLISILCLAGRPGKARADLLQNLEAGDFSGAKSLLDEYKSKGDKIGVDYFKALTDFYEGDLGRANLILSQISTQTYSYTAWLTNYLSDVFPIQARMVKQESKHFLLLTDEKNKFLGRYALETLEAAYDKIGHELDAVPQNRVHVEIYSTQEDFSKASTLSKELLDKSGAVGICKYRRLMILSPDQLAFGYRWQDTLAHELTHYLINIVSGGKCPLWLHEGIAKYSETLWRLPEPQYLTPGNRTELAKAIKNDQLIPFSRMAPSMVYLKDQNEVRTAFSEVTDAVNYAVKKQGVSLNKLLSNFNKKDVNEPFYASMGINFEKFEKDWEEHLKNEKLEESAGAMADSLKMGKEGDEVEEFAGTDIRGHLRLGDRFRQKGENQVAIFEYEKALKEEPDNPVALTKMARAYMAFSNYKEAGEYLEKCVTENPNYGTAYTLLCGLRIRDENWEKALEYALEANSINPFNPEVHRQLSEIYKALGKKDLSETESETARSLGSQE